MTRSSRVVAFAVVAASSLVAAGCSAGESTVQPTTTAATPTSVTVVGPDAFARRIEEPGVVTINVHVPDEGRIAGTDAAIPFDQITNSAALPDGRDTPLAVYCRSGNMSADAVRDLQALGYTDIVELDGGFNAWTNAGRSLEPPGS